MTKNIKLTDKQINAVKKASDEDIKKALHKSAENLFAHDYFGFYKNY